MSRLSIVGATALLLALAVGTPTFAVGLRGVQATVAVRCMSAAAGSAVLKQSVGSVVSMRHQHSIAPSVGRTTTRRPGSIWATMVSGVLAGRSPLCETGNCGS